MDAGASPEPNRDPRWDEPYRGKYTDDAKWLCRPGLPNNPCAASLRVADMLPDGSLEVRQLANTPDDTTVDCFYTYPTVDVGLLAPPRNLDFPQIDRAPLLDVMSAQALPFREVCNVYSPVYRQASLVSLAGDEKARTDGIEFGYADVADAFDYFLRSIGPGRPFVLLAHSQGSMVMLRLIQRMIEHDPRLLERLVVAVLAGPLGAFNVPNGAAVGGTFEDIPLCGAQRQTGCVLTFNSFLKENPPSEDYGAIGGGIPAGHDTGCTNPATYNSDVTRVKGALFPVRYRQPDLSIPLDLGNRNIDADYLQYADFYTAQCATSSRGLSYLEIAMDPADGDTRKNVIPFDHLALSDPSLGLHALDYSFIAGELREAVKTKISAYSQVHR